MFFVSLKDYELLILNLQFVGFFLDINFFSGGMYFISVSAYLTILVTMILIQVPLLVCILNSMIRQWALFKDWC